MVSAEQYRMQNVAHEYHVIEVALGTTLTAA